MTDQKLELLLKYVKAGFYLLPLHWPINGTTCSCSDPKCKRIGKHPRIHNGVKEASKNTHKITKWHETWPEANWALATGVKSGILVVDIDPKHGGNESLAQYRMPLTASVITGSGGKHYYFVHPKETIRNSNGRVGKGIDIRTNDGYVVIPPSKHASGDYYTWKIKPSDIGGFAELPKELLNKLVEISKEPIRIESAEGMIEEGQRNDMLIAMAGWMRWRGFNAAAIEAAILSVNEIACDPPVEHNEVMKLINSALRWQKGK